MKAYIISYFGTHEPDKRREQHTKQLEFLQQYNFDVYVLNQEYQEQDYAADVTYIGNNQRMRPVDGRNVLFEHFYKTDDDYAFFFDNDILITSYSEKDVLSAMFEQGTHDAMLEHRIGVAALSNPIHLPGELAYKQEKELFDTTLMFRTTPIEFKESCFVMLNWKKHNNEEFYVDYNLLVNDRNRNFSMANGESMLISEHCYANGYRAANTPQLHQTEFSSKSTWATSQNEYRSNIIAKEEMFKRLGWKYKAINAGDTKFRYIGYIDTPGKTRVSYRRIKDEKRIGTVHKHKAHNAIFEYWHLPYPMTNQEMSEYAQKEFADHPIMSKFPNYLDKDKIQLVGRPNYVPGLYLPL